MDISPGFISQRDGIVSAMFERYAPAVKAFCRDVASGNYHFSNLSDLRRNLDILKEFRHKYRGAVVSGRLRLDEGLSNFFDAIHIIEHGIWAIYGSNRLKQVAGEELGELRLDLSGQVGYNDGLDAIAKQDTDSARYARLKHNYDGHDADLNDNEQGATHTLVKDSKGEIRLSLVDELDDIIMTWSPSLITAAKEVVDSNYMASVEYVSVPAPQLDSTHSTLNKSSILDSFFQIKGVLAKEVLPRLSLYFEGNESTKNSGRARYFVNVNRGREEFASWLQRDLKPWKPAQQLEALLIKHGDILEGIESKDYMSKISDHAILFLLDIEAAWTLSEHMEGIHELVKHDAGREVYTDDSGNVDYGKMGREIFFAGAFANYLINQAILNLNYLKE